MIHKDKVFVADNVGSAIIEICMIVPIIVFVCVMAIMLFFDDINDAVIQNNAYSALYTYDGLLGDGQVVDTVTSDTRLVSVGRIAPDIFFSKSPNNVEIGVCENVINSGIYSYSVRKNDYKTEFEVCTKRLRGWQFYGDTFCE